MIPRKLIRYAGYDPTEGKPTNRDPNRVNKASAREPKLFAFDGKNLSINGWAIYLGVTSSVLRQRIKNWTLERALTTSPKLQAAEPANV